MNFTQIVWRNSHAWPDRPAIVFDGRSWAYKDLRIITELVAARLREAGVARGDCVALDLRSPMAQVVVVLALAYLGATSTPLEGQSPESKEIVLARHSARWVVRDGDSPWTSTTLPADSHLAIDGLFRPPAGSETLARAALAENVDDEPWSVALSSGTTGVPKSIARTHRATMLSHALGRQVATPEPERVFVFTFMSVYMGIGNALRTLLAGDTLLLASRGDVPLFFEIVARDKPTRLYTSTGNAAAIARHASTLPASREVCGSLHTVTLAGSSVPPALQQAIRQQICPNLEINYGATEAGAMARATADTLASHPQSAGRLYGWVDAQAVDENDQPLAAGQVGALRFRTPAMAFGYLGDAEATERAFREGWFYPGDIGAIDAAGFVMLQGRVDHLLNFGGDKVDPVVIENVLNSHPAVMESAVLTALSGDGAASVLVAIVVPRGQAQARELRQWCEAKLGARKTPSRVVFTQALPKNASGKLHRAELPALLRAESLPRPVG